MYFLRLRVRHTCQNSESQFKAARFQLILFTPSPVSLLDRLIRYATLFPHIFPRLQGASFDLFYTIVPI